MGVTPALPRLQADARPASRNRAPAQWSRPKLCRIRHTEDARIARQENRSVTRRGSDEFRRFLVTELLPLG